MDRRRAVADRSELLDAVDAARFVARGADQKTSDLTPCAVPSRHTLALWRAKMPTVTTPGHWLISVSIASGSVMRRPRTSRIGLAVVGDARRRARRAWPPQRGEAARDLRRGHRDHLHRQRKAPEHVARSLRLVGDADEALGQVGDDLLARQRRAAALDHVAARGRSRRRRRCRPACRSTSLASSTRMPCARSRSVLAVELDTAPGDARPSSSASASMKWLTVEPVPTPTTLPGTT